MRLECHIDSADSDIECGRGSMSTRCWLGRFSARSRLALWNFIGCMLQAAAADERSVRDAVILGPAYLLIGVRSTTITHSLSLVSIGVDTTETKALYSCVYVWPLGSDHSRKLHWNDCDCCVNRVTWDTLDCRVLCEYLNVQFS